MRKLAFLGLNDDQVPYLSEAIRLGLEIHGFDRNLCAPGRELVQKFYNYGYDEPELIERALLKAGFGEFDLVFTAASQFAHLSAARLARRFGLTYPSTHSIETVLSKFRYYPFFQSLGIPIPPTTYVRSASELQGALSRAKLGSNYYLKSDKSKNPRYVFSGRAKELSNADIPWIRDQFLSEGYVLQEEVHGMHLRLNVLEDRVAVFDFHTGDRVDAILPKLEEVNALGLLSKLGSQLGMINWLLKYDLVYSPGEFSLLDIGIDPPSRLIQHRRGKFLSTEALYLRHYLGIGANSASELFR